MPSILAGDETANGQVTASVSVSVQLQRCLTYRILKPWFIVIEQTAHNLGLSTSFSALEISDLPPPVSVHPLVNLVHYILHLHQLDCQCR